MVERRRRYWGIWLLGDFLAIEGFLGILVNWPPAGGVLQGAIGVVGVILIVIGAAGDYR